jgi:hypothetical protein
MMAIWGGDSWWGDERLVVALDHVLDGCDVGSGRAPSTHARNVRVLPGGSARRPACRKVREQSIELDRDPMDSQTRSTGCATVATQLGHVCVLRCIS